MSDSINALIGAQRNASVIDSLAHPAVINPLAGIKEGAEAARTVFGMRELAGKQAWNDALAASTDPQTGRIDYGAATARMAASGKLWMGDAATQASPLMNDQVSRGHYHLGILQGLFGGLDENVSPAQLRAKLNATFDQAKALGLSPTDVETDRAAMPKDDAELPGFVRQLRFSASTGAEQAGYGAGTGGMSSTFLHDIVEVPDPDNPGKTMSVVRGSLLGAPGFPPVAGGNRSGAANAPPATTGGASSAPPDPSKIDPSYGGGFKPKGASTPAAAAAPAPAATPPVVIPPAFTATGGPPSATVTTTPPVVVPSSPSGAPAAASTATAGAPPATAATPPPANYGGPPASGARAPGAAVAPPAPALAAPRGVPEATNAPSVTGTLAALNPFRIGSAEAQTFRGPGPQVSKDIDAYNAAVPTIQPQRQNIIAGEAALKALELANTGPGTAAMSLAKRFLIAQGFPGADAIDLNAENAREILNKNLIRFAQGSGGNASTDFARSLNQEGNPSADTLLKGANRHVLVQDVGILRQKLAQTLTAPPGVGKTEFGDGFTDHTRNFFGQTDWHGFAWDWMDPSERGAYLEEISKDKRAQAIFERSKRIAKANGLWTRAPDAPPPPNVQPAAPAVNLLTPPAP